MPRFFGICIPRCEIQEQEFTLHQENSKKKKKKTQMILDSTRGSTRTRTSSTLQKERTQDKTNPTKSIFKKETLNCMIIYMQVEDNKEILTFREPTTSIFHYQKNLSKAQRINCSIPNANSSHKSDPLTTRCISNS